MNPVFQCCEHRLVKTEHIIAKHLEANENQCDEIRIEKIWLSKNITKKVTVLSNVVFYCVMGFD